MQSQMMMMNTAPPCYAEAAPPCYTDAVSDSASLHQSTDVGGPHQWSPVRAKRGHYHYAWKSLDDVPYERLPSGMKIKVSAPNGGKQPIAVDSSELLKTKVFATPGAELLVSRLCSHFHAKGKCARGAQCDFAHRVHVDPSAQYGPNGIPDWAPITTDGIGSHINFAWKALQDVDGRYQRCAPGTTVKVTPGGDGAQLLELRSEELLQTQALQRLKVHSRSELLVGRLCSHFHSTGKCRRGVQCDFIHHVHVDPSAQYSADGVPRRAPLGAGAHRVPAPQPREVPLPSCPPPQEEVVEAQHDVTNASLPSGQSTGASLATSQTAHVSSVDEQKQQEQQEQSQIVYMPVPMQMPGMDQPVMVMQPVMMPSSVPVMPPSIPAIPETASACPDQE